MLHCEGMMDPYANSAEAQASDTRLLFYVHFMDKEKLVLLKC